MEVQSPDNLNLPPENISPPPTDKVEPTPEETPPVPAVEEEAERQVDLFAWNKGDHQLLRIAKSRDKRHREYNFTD